MFDKSVDTETTGLDFTHGARPFFVTTCNDEGEITYWEADVNPINRIPIWPKADLFHMREVIIKPRGGINVLQSAKFDVKAFDSIGLDEWDWASTHDTLMSGHLLASNQPHDLTSMALIYLGVNIKPLEEALNQAITEARRLCRSKLPDWMIAKEGLECMPSAKEKCSKFDMWLPRAIIKEAIHKLRFELIHDHPQLPKVAKIGKEVGVRIDRKTKWGNPYVIGKDGDRETVIKKYAKWVWTGEGQGLIADLPELYGQTILCHCSPDQCHGEVLRALCHPWRTVLAEYSNADSEVTLPLHREHVKIMKYRGVYEIYLERLKLLPIIYGMETRGVAISKERTESLKVQYTESMAKAGRICCSLSEGILEEMPKGLTNELKRTMTEALGLVSPKLTDNGNPSYDKFVIDEWLVTLPQRTKQYTFIKNLRAFRKRQTALSYIETYEKYWIPLTEPDKDGKILWYNLYSSLNPTGTDTLRFSSENPNQQQISKQEIEEEDGEAHSARYMFGPAPGREWWSCDAKNIELRLTAYEAGEAAMIELFERPDDPPYFGSNHLLFAHLLHEQRFEEASYSKDVPGHLDGRLFKKKYNSTWYQWTKNGDFAVQYGAMASSGTADRAYHVPGGQAKIEGKLTNIKKLSERMIRMAEATGYVETMPDKTVNPRKGYPLLCTRTKWGSILPTVPLSYRIQGTAMWWMMKAMIRCQYFLDDLNKRKGKPNEYRMVMQIHDELVFDFPKGNGKEPWKTNLPYVNEIQRLMALGGDDIGVPTPASCEYHEHNWGEGKSV